MRVDAAIGDVNGLHNEHTQGRALHDWLLSADLCAIDTFFPSSPSYVGRGSRTYINHIVAQPSLLPMVSFCKVWERAGKRLRYSPKFWDHLPLVARLRIPMPTMPRQPHSETFDFDLLADALQNGTGRAAFLQELDRDLKAKANLFGRLSTEDNPDRHMALYAQILRRVALNHFSKAAAVSPQHASDKKTLLSLLCRRRCLRDAARDLPSNPRGGGAPGESGTLGASPSSVPTGLGTSHAFLPFVNGPQDWTVGVSHYWSVGPTNDEYQTEVGLASGVPSSRIRPPPGLDPPSPSTASPHRMVTRTVSTAISSSMPSATSDALGSGRSTHFTCPALGTSQVCFPLGSAPSGSDGDSPPLSESSPGAIEQPVRHSITREGLGRQKNTAVNWEHESSSMPSATFGETRSGRSTHFTCPALGTSQVCFPLGSAPSGSDGDSPPLSENSPGAIELPALSITRVGLGRQQTAVNWEHDSCGSPSPYPTEMGEGYPPADGDPGRKQTLPSAPYPAEMDACGRHEVRGSSTNRLVLGTSRECSPAGPVPAGSGCRFPRQLECPDAIGLQCDSSPRKSLVAVERAITFELGTRPPQAPAGQQAYPIEMGEGYPPVVGDPGRKQTLPTTPYRAEMASGGRNQAKGGVRRTSQATSVGSGRSTQLTCPALGTSQECSPSGSAPLGSDGGSPPLSENSPGAIGQPVRHSITREGLGRQSHRGDLVHDSCGVLPDRGQRTRHEVRGSSTTLGTRRCRAPALSGAGAGIALGVSDSLVPETVPHTVTPSVGIWVA